MSVIEKAKTTCKSLHLKESDHFTNVGKMIDLGKGATRRLDDIALSRYACYLIVQNGDPSKPVIALGQTYFAVQTRRQELSDQNAFNQLNDDEKRLEGNTSDRKLPKGTSVNSMLEKEYSSRELFSVS